MLGTFLDKATGLLDRNFLLAYWFPVFIAMVLAVLIGIWAVGWSAALVWWMKDWTSIQGINQSMESNEVIFFPKLWFILGLLIIITVIAYLLQVFTRHIIRFYEGYWPLSLRRWYTGAPLLGIKRRWQKIRTKRTEAYKNEDWHEYSSLHFDLFYGYPTKEELLMPTKLGNTLRAAEEYSKATYGMDSVFWWPRLWPLLPESIRGDIEETLTPLVAMLNFASLIAILSIFGSAFIKYEGFSWWQTCLVLIGGLGLAFISYRGAVAQARSYGEKIRATIDLFRFELLKALHQPLPSNLENEFDLWEKLLDWLYKNELEAITDDTYNHGDK